MVNVLVNVQRDIMVINKNRGFVRNVKIIVMNVRNRRFVRNVKMDI